MLAGLQVSYPWTPPFGLMRWMSRPGPSNASFGRKAAGYDESDLAGLAVRLETRPAQIRGPNSNLLRNRMLKCEELLKPVEYAMSVIDVSACSGSAIVS